MYHVALAKDYKGDFFCVAEDVANFRELLNLLEDIGAEVVEDQTADWDGDVEGIKLDCYSIDELLTLTDFVGHNNTLEDDCIAIGIQSLSAAERNGSLC
jgi:hypothetical protein